MLCCCVSSSGLSPARGCFPSVLALGDAAIGMLEPEAVRCAAVRACRGGVVVVAAVGAAAVLVMLVVVVVEQVDDGSCSLGESGASSASSSWKSEGRFLQ